MNIKEVYLLGNGRELMPGELSEVGGPMGGDTLDMLGPGASNRAPLSSRSVLVV